MCLNFLHINENVGLYFFSAVFQGNMALCALIAVFMIYKLQQMDNKLESIESITLDYIKSTFNTLWSGAGFLPPPPMKYTYLMNIFDTLDEIIQKYSGQNSTYTRAASELKNDNYLLEKLEEYQDFIDNRENIKSSFLLPFLLLISVVVLSLIMLFFINHIHTVSQTVEKYLIILTIIINIYAIECNSKYIIKLIRM